jgi:two-component system chemotaxis response regulator CheY
MVEPPGRRLLVIDDASLVRRYYRGALEQAGFEVEEALNGVEALERLLVGHFDLVIVDVNMPQMDGITFLDALRRQGSRLASLPALMISTEAAAHDKAAARAAGANYYLVKPVTPEVLLEHVRIMCGVPS